MNVAQSTRTAVAPSTQTLARLIAEYLHEHPQARDTALGVCDWWLGALAPVEAVEAALAFLADRGLVRRNQRNGQALYSLNPDFQSRGWRELLTDEDAESA